MRTTIARPRTAPDPMPDWAHALLEGQTRVIEGHARVIEEVRELCAQLAPRPPAINGDVDVAIARAIAEIGLTQFSAPEVLALRATDSALALALDAAMIESAEQLGKCFARLYRRRLLDRDAKRGRHGWRWRM